MSAELSSPATGHRFTQKQLLAEAARAGFVATKALIERWVGYGLLDIAQTSGRGDRKGVLRTWSDDQRQLWLTLLSKRREADSPTALANVPVLVWLYWGDRFVPLRQVRRALETFSEVGKKAVRHDYPHAARKLVRDFARPGADAFAKAALVDALVESGKSRRFDEEEIERLLIKVVGPRDPSAQADGPRVAGILAAQWAARTRFYEFQDGHFRWARMLMLYSQADYSRVRPYLAADARFGHIHEPYDLDRVANNACRDLLLSLGIGLVAPPNPSLPEFLRLETWLQGRGRVSTTIEETRSPLWLPRGQVHGGLNIQVHVTIDPPTSLTDAENVSAGRH